MRSYDALAGVRLLRKIEVKEDEREERGRLANTVNVRVAHDPKLMCLFILLTHVPVCRNCCKLVWRKSLS